MTENSVMHNHHVVTGAKRAIPMILVGMVLTGCASSAVNYAGDTVTVETKGSAAIYK